MTYFRSVLILAAGNQTRWGKHPIKQLLPIGDTTIIERVYNQVEEYRPIVVTCKQEIWDLLTPCYCPISPKRWTVETLLNTKQFWNDQTVILLGDVIYSKRVIKRVLDFDGEFRAFGNEWEIFALSFQLTELFEHRLKTTVGQAERGEYKGTLRHFFRVYTGTNEDTRYPYFEVIDHMTDYTNDIDNAEEYENFLREWGSSVE